MDPCLAPDRGAHRRPVDVVLAGQIAEGSTILVPLPTLFDHLLVELRQ
jgi:hypothetical protein